MIYQRPCSPGEHIHRPCLLCFSQRYCHSSDGVGLFSGLFILPTTTISGFHRGLCQCQLWMYVYMGDMNWVISVFVILAHPVVTSSSLPALSGYGAALDGFAGVPAGYITSIRVYRLWITCEISSGPDETIHSAMSYIYIFSCLVTCYAVMLCFELY